MEAEAAWDRGRELVSDLFEQELRFALPREVRAGLLHGFVPPWPAITTD